MADNEQETNGSGFPAGSGNESCESELACTPASHKVSARKIKANQENAKKSTGPKTAAGKARVRGNAVKHGFFSKWLLVKDVDGSESQDEYDEFYAKLRHEYEPVGILEELCLETIVISSWRKRRVMRFERGLVARALVEHRLQIQRSRAPDLVQSEFAEPAEPELDAITDHLFLPEREELDKLLAEETLISRELEHAIAELERLKARRKRKNESGGENLPKQSPEGL